MHKLTIIGLAMFFSAMASGCSGEKPAQDQAQAQSATARDNAQQTAAPTPASSIDPSQLPKDGKVLKAMHAGGYTYMQIEKDGKEFWIAATMMNVKRDDYVRWADAAVMKNFNSSTLHKRFDEILFVTNAELNQ